MAIPYDLVRRVPVTRSTAFAVLAALLLLMLSAEVAGAAVPDPRTSTVPRCLPICPSGDRSFTIVVRDVNNTPINGASVAVELSHCANLELALCEDCEELPNFNPVLETFTRISNAAGEATFRLCGSIACPGGGAFWVDVVADGVPLSRAAFVTTDLDFDLDVDAADVAIVTAAEGGTLPEADQDCNGNIDGADTAEVEAHLGHVCPGVVPSAPTSWGSVKSTYR